MRYEYNFPASAKHADILGGSRKVELQFNTFIVAAALAMLAVNIAMGHKTSRDRTAERILLVKEHEVIESQAELGERIASRELALRDVLGGASGRRGDYSNLDHDAAAFAAKLVGLVADNPSQLERATQLRTAVDWAKSHGGGDAECLHAGERRSPPLHSRGFRVRISAQHIGDKETHSSRSGGP